MWVTKLSISPVKIRIFCSRTTQFGPKLAFLPGLAGSFGALLVGWLEVVAQAVSCKTPIYFIIFFSYFFGTPFTLFPMIQSILNKPLNAGGINYHLIVWGVHIC